ncbi:MAG TPA: XdhC/CoxI family protein [Pyrinomonadaceae bacterium]|nr:XdhC/CoxI family protein [Pyrinomonadaceae bacterium]
MKTSQLTDAINRALDEGARAVLATLVSSDSATVSVGEKLIVPDSGERVGTFGDEALDEAVARHAAKFLQSRDEAKSFRTDELAPELTAFAGTAVLFERLESEPSLVIAGAGHVGASLARLAALTGYRVTLIDDRAEFVDRKLFAEPSAHAIELVAAEDWQAALRRAIGNGRGVSVAIVTRGHKQDEDCLRAAIETSPDYIGMIGSKRRTNIVLDKLREEGANDAQLKKVRAPIGLDIAAVSPEEVALAILAEIVAERRGGTGGSLSKWRRA